MTARDVTHASKLLNTKWQQTFKSVFKRDKYILENLYTRIQEVPPPDMSPTRALFIIGKAHATLPYVLRRQIADQGLEKNHAIQEMVIDPNVDYTQMLFRQYMTGQPLSVEAMLKAELEKKNKTRNPELSARIAAANLDETTEAFLKVCMEKPRQHIGSAALQI